MTQPTKYSRWALGQTAPSANSYSTSSTTSNNVRSFLVHGSDPDKRFRDKFDHPSPAFG
jgi:hypothetical protein